MKVATTLRPGLLVMIILLGACSHQKHAPEPNRSEATTTKTSQPASEPKHDEQSLTVEAPTEPTPKTGADTTSDKPTSVNELITTTAVEKTETPVSGTKPDDRSIPDTPEPKIDQQEKLIAKPPIEPVRVEPETQKTAASATIQKTGVLAGKISIIGKRNKEYRPTNVIVTLTPLNPAAHNAMHQDLRTHEVDMKNKTYLPVVQTIRRGDTLQFNNNDNIKHNVFSSSGENTFDLGTFKGGSVRSVAMDHSGIVKVYCNIHPEMATFVMVSDYPYHAISEKDGSFQIDKIPAGNYELSLWHIRGELKTTITISEGQNNLDNLVLDASNYKRVAHKNKYGKDYKKKPALFEDEFY